MWAFLSVELVLLLIFMNVSPTHPLHPVDLAGTEHAAPMPGALREDAMLVAVTRDGRVFFGTYEIRYDDLPALIRESIRSGSERKVYLKVDTRAQYGDAAAVIDQVRLSGIENIAIITAQRQPSQP
jgi:biopolymer transport protein TolR